MAVPGMQDLFPLTYFSFSGKLTFSLLKSTYQSFGIVGLSQSKADKQRQKHGMVKWTFIHPLFLADLKSLYHFCIVVQIDVRDPKFVPGGKLYERLKWCLEANFKEPMEMVATCYDKGWYDVINFLTWSKRWFVAKKKETGRCIDIQWPEGVKATKNEMTAQFDHLQSADIPTFAHLRRSLSDKPDAEWREQVIQATEWIGLAHIKANRLASNDRPQSFVTLYSSPKPVLTEQTGTLITWQGLIPMPFIRHIAISLRKVILVTTMEGSVINRLTESCLNNKPQSVGHQSQYMVFEIHRTPGTIFSITLLWMGKTITRWSFCNRRRITNLIKICM